MAPAPKSFWRKVTSERGSVFAEYAMLTSFVTLFAIAAFAPGSRFMNGIGWDYNFRELLIKLPIF